MTSELHTILTAVKDVIDQRAALMDTARRLLQSIGHETLIIDCRNAIPLGERVYVDECHGGSNEPSYGVSVDRLPQRDSITLSTWRDMVFLRVPLGSWQVVLSDDKRHLFVQVHADELAHRRSVPKLRTWAAKSGLRVRARGDHMQLIDPLGYVAHEGTIASAFRWLCGYENPAEEVAA